MIEGSILTRKRKFSGSHVWRMIERASYDIPVYIEKYTTKINDEDYFVNEKFTSVKSIRGLAATKKNTLSSTPQNNYINGRIIIYSTEYLHENEDENTNIYFEVVTVPTAQGRKANKYKLISLENWGCYYIYNAKLAY